MIYECNDDLAEILKALRTNQRNFFAAQPGTLARATALQESKRLEKLIDEFLKQREEEKNKPIDLFSQ